ncbi:MAG: metallophosphoesterase family protein [Candidatus Aureabacteria bacterium]|nr:metallophosphoesterase family protein [Candidatus Auribacterota bacterium]
MRYAIFGDVHGNLEALRAVFKDIDRAGVEQLLCLGDIVGYGAEPGSCMREIISRKAAAVQGNHDSAAVGGTPLEYFSIHARRAIEWTMGQLDDDERGHLASLPLARRIGDFIVVHASLDEPREWYYVTDTREARRCFARLEGELCFIGHSHRPGAFVERDDIEWCRDAVVALAKGARYIVNAGSVGQPRDGDPRAAWVLYDSAKRRVEFRRAAYDVPGAQKKILAAGLPPYLAERLKGGR